VDADNRVLYVHGDLRHLIRVAEGEPNLDLIRMLDKNLRSRLRSGFFKARQTKAPVVLRSPTVFNENMQQNPPLQITINHMDHPELHEDALTVTFEEVLAVGLDFHNRSATVAASDQEKMIE